ncbi:caspase family protein [Moorena sp. SIO3H5]|uniref:caspase family protein n=1 Tax=Moorena sp. SIO3H5 TaxID=2607834 RepID=UPI0013BD0F1F|nr:caspase family protein [Moorena sp. SIO3H5]NEO69774.1 caspase family protein [Moorena sp. SIO3H5]
MPNSNLYALLIGIDCYLPNQLPDGSYYPRLNGCVRDINHVADFLKVKLKLQEDKIFTLTASNIGKFQPPEPPEKWPTYENMVTIFTKLTDIAQPGDQLYIHYSGHGGCAKTNYPKVKGENGIDEALVPIDIGNSTARYLRDLELAKLLERMVEKGLIVTLVLDSCHSGEATRGNDCHVRGLNTIDTTVRPTESLVATEAELIQNWEALTTPETRNVSLGSGWLPQPQGYVLLAACRRNESAYEYAFDGKEFNGVLTYWLLDSLYSLEPGLTYKVLQDRILAKINSQFQTQTPQLQGEGERVVFGSDCVSLQYAVDVMKVEQNKGLFLNAGQVQGLRQGAQFAIYPYGTTDFTSVKQPLALAEITQLGATESWCEITEVFRKEPIEQGSQALLINPKFIKLVQKIRLFSKTENELPPEIYQRQSQAWQTLSDAIVTGQGWVELASDHEIANYQITLNINGEYEICDPSGTPIKNLRPALRFTDEDAALTLVKRLVHLAKYRAVQQLDNYYQKSKFSGSNLALTVELAGKQIDYDPVEEPLPQPISDPGHTPTVNVGEWVFVRIRNDSSQALNVTLLALQPDWSIEQVYPYGGANFITFYPGDEELLPLHTNLPNGYQEGQDIIKVFATVGTTDFHWLELPPLDQPIMAMSGKTSGNPLDELLGAIASEQPPTKNLELMRNPVADWITKQVVVRTKLT